MFLFFRNIDSFRDMTKNRFFYIGIKKRRKHFVRNVDIKQVKGKKTIFHSEMYIVFEINRFSIN